MALIGCGAQGGGSQAAGHTTSVPSASAMAGSSPGATAGAIPVSPGSSAAQKLPTGCASVLGTTELDRVLGRHLAGTTQPIRGVAEPAIGRTGRLTCRYGVRTDPRPTVSGSPAVPPPSRTTDDMVPVDTVPVEVSLSTYRDADAASQRVDFTIHEQQATGARATDATVAGVSAILLTGQRQSTLVLSYREMTLALSMAADTVPARRTEAVATALGDVVMHHLGLGVPASD